jgi:transketolase
MLRDLRKQIVLAACGAGEGHIPSAFSVLDIIWVLYDKVLKYDPARPKWEDRDRFVLSKGHASLALYAVLAAKGFFDPKLLETFAKPGSILGGHPDWNKVPGVEASTGSLGHGLPVAVGKALARKIQQKPGRVFCLVGDGECNEGSIWEACLLAAHHKLDNLCLIVDYNHSTDRALRLEGLALKFHAFGFDTTHIVGHNPCDIEAALRHQCLEKPTAVVAETTKGYGCKRMENSPEWHHRVPNAKELEEILAELT